MKRFFGRLINYMLDKSTLIRDLIKAVGAMTTATRELTQAMTTLARLQIEDREAIIELYSMHAEVLNNLPAKTVVTKLKASTLTPIEQVAQEKKKKTTN